MAAETDAASEDRSAERSADDSAPGARRWPMIGFVLAAVVVVLDQISKVVMLRSFGPEVFSEACKHASSRRPICPALEISPIFDLTMVWNRGVSFGMFQAESGFGRWALVTFSAAVAAVLAAWLRRTRRPIAAIALGLVIGGAIGNLIDRARFGAVADFLDFSGMFFPWVFNVADASITVGAALLVLEILLERRAQR